MPIYHIKENDKKFFRFGKTGKKYYYNNEKDMLKAYNNAIKQMKAIQVNRKI